MQLQKINSFEELCNIKYVQVAGMHKTFGACSADPATSYHLGHHQFCSGKTQLVTVCIYIVGKLCTVMLDG